MSEPSRDSSTPDRHGFTVERVAQWLLDEIERHDGHLLEAIAALEIVRHFGGDFSIEDEQGAFIVSPHVRDALDRIAIASARRVEWDPQRRAWRINAGAPVPYR